ncbi:hypothetical protein PR202_ga23167 [Eleusine coracana subsp. coracana]|uniref:BHLH domain-containing protein n=1 Tax=Eleusine coracana subsp. coracana TaxID=191504 RepID=A0AAV5D3K7_ELECO|nr:hypothetical protein QOZ80_1AG0013180 [Eleusine coracana subsp. coracana]GJN05533.1 hypothetical protein PR202_ga23167 [Eleusine coracana subsp. coracana]
MDNSWFHGGYTTVNTTVGNNGFMCGYAASCAPAELQHKEDEEELLMSSQIQHHLNQISMHMNMEDEVAAYEGALALDIQQHPMVDGLLDPHHATSSFPSSSSSSLSLRSASLSCSPESSAQIFGGGPPATAMTAIGQQYPEVSSHVPLPVPPAVPYTTNVHVPTPPLSSMAGDQLLPAAKKAGAFKSFARHMGPRRQPKPGACGQRMFKTALSVLSKMHVAASARYTQQHQQQYYYNQQASAAEAAAAAPSVNQLQHMISERKRREKLNDSFHALKTVLPPGAKKDKTSILIRAREYIRSLESRASELEEKNKSLESRLIQRGSSGDNARKHAGGDRDNSGGDKVQIEITRAAKEEEYYWAAMEPRDLCTLKIVLRSRCNMTDVVLRTLQCLKDQVGGDVSLVSMNTSAEPQTNSSPRGAVLTMQVKSSLLVGAQWEEQAVKDAVAKVVADALILPSSSTAAEAAQRQ